MIQIGEEDIVSPSVASSMVIAAIMPRVLSAPKMVSIFQRLSGVLS
jgi:hypothetical protein